VSFEGFSERTFEFLVELSRSGDPAWLEERLDDYQRLVVEPAQGLVEALGPRLKALDPEIRAIPRVRGSIKSLERRRRFPKSREPRFRDSLDLWFWSGPRQSWDNSGFYLRMTRTELVLAAGMIEFQKATLTRYRENLLDEAHGAALSAVVEELRARGYVVMGEGYQRTPKGIPADHPRAALAKHRGLFATLTVEHPPELRTPAFPDFLMAHFMSLAPLHAWLVAGPARRA